MTAGQETESGGRSLSSSLPNPGVSTGNQSFLGEDPYAQSQHSPEQHQARLENMDADVGYPVPLYDPKRSKSMH